MLKLKKDMKAIKITCLLNLLCSFAFSQKPSANNISGFYPLLRNYFVEENAFNTVKYVEQRWRIAGNTGFNESIFFVEKILQDAGFKQEKTDEKEGPLTYRIEKRKMKRLTWEPYSASLQIEGENIPVLDFTSNRNMLAINSAPTPVSGVSAEIVYVGKGSKAEIEGKDLKGKILFGEASIGSIYNLAMKNGAIGALTYNVAAYNQPEKNIHSIQFSQIPYLDSAKQKWGILLSFEAKERLKTALSKGKVMVHVFVSSKLYAAEELTLVANARGVLLPDERFVFSAHVQEPGANDNATGVGTLAEMARVTAKLIKEKKIKPARTITFLWGDEIISTGRYIKDDTVRAKGIKWGLSLDMVGEDIAKTGGSFLIEKMPDPSAIWTRGDDNHSEWGGRPLQESELFPHYFNDFLLNRCYEQGKENTWLVKANPFEGGSDHTPFLQAKIPGLLMWHFTDQFYHTDADRLDMVSASEMKNVGVSALVAAYTLVTADEKTTLQLIDEITASAIARLTTEGKLSKESLQKGGKLDYEQHILQVWTSWYAAAIERMTEIKVGGSSLAIQNKIEEAKKIVSVKLNELLTTLTK